VTHAANADGEFVRATATGAQVNERFLEAGRYLDNYDAFVGRVMAVQQKLAKRSNSDVVKSLVETRADLKRQVTSAYAAAARRLIS
jgi:hypothetical protein